MGGGEGDEGVVGPEPRCDDEEEEERRREATTTTTSDDDDHHTPYPLSITLPPTHTTHRGLLLLLALLYRRVGGACYLSLTKTTFHNGGIEVRDCVTLVTYNKRNMLQE